MKIVTIDGMALIGPGSEWLWTALQFAALALTFIAIYRQLRAQRLELLDNSKALRSQAHYNALSLVQRPWELMIENDGLAKVVTAGSTNPESLSAADWLRCSSYFFMQFNGWEYFYYQHGDDSIPKQLWTGADSTFKHLIETTPGYVRFWSESQASFDEPFRSYVGREFAQKPAPVPAPG